MSPLGALLSALAGAEPVESAGLAADQAWPNPAARQLILDTGVLIDCERGLLADSDIGAPDDDVAIAAITVAEFTAWVLRANDTGPAGMRQRFLDTVLRHVDVLSYGPSTAAIHAGLIATGIAQGRLRDAHDLIVAAHALETGRTLVTGDVQAHLDDLPDVSVRFVRRISDD